MKSDNKKALYESIMTSVAKEVKKALNENKEDYSIARNIYDIVTKNDSGNTMYLDVVLRQESGWSTHTLFSKNVYGNDKDSAEILNFSNDCFDGDIITDSNAAIIRKLTEMENDESCKGYIVFEELPYVRGKKVSTYKFVIKLTDDGVNLANDITNKRKIRQDDKYNNTDQLERKLTDLNVSGRMNKYLSKKYGISYFAIEDVKFMSDKIAYKLLDIIKNDKIDNNGDMVLKKFRYNHFDNKIVRDVSNKIEIALFKILEDLKNVEI